VKRGDVHLLALGVLSFVCALLPGVAGGQSQARHEQARAPMVAGELIVRLRPDFPACAHCLLAKRTGLKGVTGTFVLDQVRLKHGITQLDPVFGGVHAADRRLRAAQRFGRRAEGEDAGQAAANLNHVYLARVDSKTDLLHLAAEFRRDPNVVSAEPNYLYHATQSAVTSRPRHPLGEGQREGSAALSNDPFLSSSDSWGQDFPDLWGLFQIHAPEAWELSQGEGVVVAVVDTGLDISHPDIAANVWHNAGEVPNNDSDDDGNGFADDINGWDFTRCLRRNEGGDCLQAKEPGPDISDPVGHGTHVAGTIAAVGGNGIGIIGVAPQAHVMAVKALDQSGVGSNRDLAEALVYAAENGATVINASWSGPPSDTIRMAVDFATALGVTVVAAAGNNAAPLEGGISPADLPNVITVGSTTHTDAHAASSNFGGPLDLVAPGGGDTEPQFAVQPGRSILSLLAHDSAWSRDCHYADNGQQACTVPPWVIQAQYIRASGTSFATAHVSGVAALIRSRHPEFTRQQVRQVLLQSADDLGAPGWDQTFGYGRVTARRAVEMGSLPVAEITAPENRGKIWEWQFPFKVRGTVLVPGSALRGWRLTVRRDGQPESHAKEVARGNEIVANGVLGTLPLVRSFRLFPGKRYLLKLEAEDVLGNVAVDTKTFLVPGPRFATIPLPDPFDAGGQNVTISSDGTRVALTRADRNGHTAVWLFDAPTRELRQVAKGGLPSILSGDGNILAYFGDDAVQFRGVLYDLKSGSYQILPYAVGLDAIDFHGMRLAFLQDPADLDPSSGDRNRSTEAFFFDAPEWRTRQITSGPKGDGYDPEVDELALSADGHRLAFTSLTDFDLTASTSNLPQVFLYDDSTHTIHQLTGRSDESPWGRRPAISADGSKVAYIAEGIGVVDVASGQIEQVVDQQGSPNFPMLSAGGSKLAFTSSLDLDPAVGNEDRIGEVFVMDLATRNVTQVTDTVQSPFGPSLAAMDAVGQMFVVGSAAEINGTGLSPTIARVIPRRHPNRSPVLEVAEVWTAQEGKTLRIPLHASDPDGDSITFFAQRVPAYPDRLRELAGSVLTDHGDGTAELAFTPRFDEAGTYQLRVAAFDEEGGVSSRDITLVIEDTQPEGDANCDRHLDFADIEALVAHLFDSGAQNQCVTADTNDDGRIDASDLAGLLLKLGQ